MRDTIFLVVAAIILLALSLRGLHAFGRVLFIAALAFGAVTGIVQGAVSQSELDLRVPLALGMLTAVATTGGRPYLLTPPEWREPRQSADAAAEAALRRHRLIFVVAATIVVVVWALVNEDAQPYG